jgi:serine/threonine protein kinase
MTYKKKLKTRRIKKRSKLGGEALTSGGFGCIFKPALKCKNTKKRTYGVSKMSIEKYGKEEITEIQNIKDRLKSIKNYDKYFLLDTELCQPDKLTEDDLKGFDEKCYALTRFNVNSKNVNSKLSNLTILNMPDAGVDLKDWLLSDKIITKEKIFLLNEVIIKLLKQAVRPMNEKGVIHNDLKDSNIMINKQLEARIIDWGLSAVVNNKKIPKEILNRPLQFNTPFSSMIISNEFKLNYDIFLQRVKDGIILFNKTNVRNYIINEYLIKLARYYGYYDDNVILFNMIFSPSISEETYLSEVKRNDLIEYGYYLYYLSNYITDILVKFTNDKYEFDLEGYFLQCYLYNSDIFGLMTTYYSFFQVKLEEIKLAEDMKKIFLNRIRSMLVETIYSNGTEKYDINKIISYIKELNQLINQDNKFSFTKMKSSLNKTRKSPVGVEEMKSFSKTPSRSRSRSKSKRNNKDEVDITRVITEVT